MSFSFRAALAATLFSVAGLGCPAPQSGQGPQSSAADAGAVAARVGGEEILVGDLDARVKEDLFEKETRGGNPALLYELRRDTLLELVRERVLQAEAARQNTSIEELLQAEAARIGPVSDEEVNAFYEENKDRLRGQTLEQVGGLIRQHLNANRESAAADGIVERADVQTLLSPPRFEVADDGPSLGPDNAPITVIEFSDFQCPFCRRASEVMKELHERYPGQVRVVYRQFPLETIHPQARAAAEASLCADDQDRFWDYHDVLFENARSLSDEQLVSYAEGLGLDVPRFQTCLSERSHKAQVDADLAQGKASGVEATPAFFVNGVLLTGALPVERFTELIDAELESGGKS